MNYKQLLDDYIKINYKNLNQFCKEHNLSYGRMHGILKSDKVFEIAAAKKIEDKIYAKTNKRIFSENTQVSSAIISSFNNDVANNYAIDTKILTKNGWKSENLRVISMPDEGMEPIIDEHAILIIDVSQTEPESGKIYAVQFGNDILIRRVIKEAGSNQYIAKPATFAFIEQNFTKKTAKILGRVIYRMGELL